MKDQPIIETTGYRALSWLHRSLRTRLAKAFAGDRGGPEWDAHGNGSLSADETIQVSDDGAAGWTAVAELSDDPSASIPLSLVGKHLRVEATAANLGGVSNAATSAARQVVLATTPLRLAAGGIGADAARARRMTANGAAAGYVIPSEAA